MEDTDIKTTLSELKRDICDLKKDFNDHKEKVEPILEGLAASKVLVRFVSWFGGFALGVGALYAMAKQILHI